MWILQKWLNFLIILSCGIAVEGSDNGFILSKRKKLRIFSVLKKAKGNHWDQSDLFFKLHVGFW